MLLIIKKCFGSQPVVVVAGCTIAYANCMNHSRTKKPMIVAGLRWRGPQGIRAISHIAALQIRRELALPDGHCLEDLLVHWSIRPIEGPMLVLDRVSWLLQSP
jgi:hypothetical protein